MDKIRSVLRSCIPVYLYPVFAVAHRFHSRLIIRKLRKKDSAYMMNNSITHMPPAHLRYRVAGEQDIEGFIARGMGLRADIEKTLSAYGARLEDFTAALDFGCGCGCTLRAFKDRPEGLALYGTDIDGEAIGWCGKNLEFASFSNNGEYPPLPYPDGKFDLCWSISVFTHLDEDHQFKWLAELKRVIRPGGYLLASVHGPHCWLGLPKSTVKKIQEDGFLFAVTKADKGIFPEWYQNAWHTGDYIRKRWSEYFDVLGCVDRGALNYQDLVVMKRREE